MIFTSDNGFAIGPHNLNGKLYQYDEAVRIPVYMRGPGLPRGVSVPTAVTNPDLAATILAAAGVEPPRPLDGVDILPWIGAPAQVRVVPIEAWFLRTSRQLYQGVRVGRGRTSRTGRVARSSTTAPGTPTRSTTSPTTRRTPTSEQRSPRSRSATATAAATAARHRMYAAAQVGRPGGDARWMSRSGAVSATTPAGASTPDCGPQRPTGSGRTGLVSEAYADGRLDRDELEARVEHLSSRLALGELALLVADLEPTNPPRRQASDGAGGTWCRELTAALGSSLACLLVWQVSGRGFFWPLWVIVYTGLPIAATLIAWPRRPGVRHGENRGDREGHAEPGGNPHHRAG